MRVVEPRQFHHLKKAKPKRKKHILPLLGVMLLMVGLWYAWEHPPKFYKTKTAQQAPLIETPISSPNVSDPNHPRTLKTLSGDDFKNLFRSLALPNTQLLTDPPVITGNDAADVRIRELAEARGYKLTSVPVNAIIRTNEEASLDVDDLLQPHAYEGWVALKAAAEKAHIPLTIFSGYRSVEFQREFFLGRLYAYGITANQIAAGVADTAVTTTLQITAVPGYSRHHSGYTADFKCNDGSANFGASTCFSWLNGDNYRHAKEHGWIPSYPDEAALQGPEPEPWEYVWVGLDVLSE